MRNWLLCIAALVGGAPLAAQAPRVPVVIPASPDGYDGCSTAYIYGLNDGRDRGFLAVRAGPSSRDRELGRLRNGDRVYACVRNGDWFGIVYEGDGRTGCNVRQALAFDQRLYRAVPLRLGLSPLDRRVFRL